MKVYLAWDGGDYYGPHALDPHVSADLVTAQHVVERDANKYRESNYKWTQTRDNHWVYGEYYIEAIEPTTLDQLPPEKPRVEVKPNPLAEQVNNTLKDIYSPALQAHILRALEPSPLLKMMEKE